MDGHGGDDLENDYVQELGLRGVRDQQCTPSKYAAQRYFARKVPSGNFVANHSESWFEVSFRSIVCFSASYINLCLRQLGGRFIVIIYKFESNSLA